MDKGVYRDYIKSCGVKYNYEERFLFMSKAKYIDPIIGTGRESIPNFV